MITLAWGSKVSPEFRTRVLHMALRLNIDPSWIMACMYFESKLNPQAINPYSGATGLIQFMPSTAIEIHTTVDALYKMSAVEQLDYVERYLTRWLRDYAQPTLADVYMAIFWPRAIGKPGDYQIVSDQTSQVYVQNKGLDLNQDGTITKDEAASYVVRALSDGLKFASLEQELRLEDITTQGETMGTVDTVATLASIFNPAIGGAIGLASNLIKAFSPLLQQKLAKEINRHTDDPATGAAIAGDVASMLVEQAKALTGKPDDFQAVAAITSDPGQAASLQKIQANLDAKLDQLGKAGDKASTWDQAMWEAQNKGKQVVSTIAIEEKRAGLWDMTRMLVIFAGVMASAMVLLITTAIIYQSVWGDNGIDVGLIGLGGPLLMAAIQCWKDVFAYRFDGSKSSTEQSRAIIETAKGKP